MSLGKVIAPIPAFRLRDSVIVVAGKNQKHVLRFLMQGQDLDSDKV